MHIYCVYIYIHCIYLYKVSFFGVSLKLLYFFFYYFFPAPLILPCAKFEQLKKKKRLPFILLTPPPDSPLLAVLGVLGEISVLGLHLGTSFCQPLCAAFLRD